MDTLKSLVETFTQKKGALKTILEKGDALTQEDIPVATALKTECSNLQNRISEFQSVGAMKTDLDGFESFASEPVRQVPFDTMQQGQGQNRPGNDGFALLGTVDAGGSYFETKNGIKTLVYEDGPGIYTPKTWKAITDPDYKRAFRDIIRYGGDERKMSAKAMKLLQEGLDDQAGYTVPVDSMVNRVIERKPTPTRIRGMVNTYTTSREYVEMLKLNYKADNVYSTGFRVTKTGENPASASAAQVNDAGLFGTVKIPVQTFMIRGLLTKNQIEDSALNLEDWMSGKFNETIEILYDDKILNGNGKMEPQGFLNSIAATGETGSGLDDPLISYLPTGDANYLTADSLIQVSEDIPEQYDEDCRYIFNKTSTHKAIRLLKDLNDRYLFGYGMQDSGLRQSGRPSDVNGYPYSWSGLMPNIAAGNVPVLFGDPKAFQFVNRIGFSIQILRELYAEVNQVALIGRVRFGGLVTEPWRMRGLRVGLT